MRSENFLQTMQQADHMRERLENQIEWMEGKSRINQRRYRILKVLEIAFAGVIPFLVGFHSTNQIFLTITGLLGVLIVLTNGVQQLYKFHENWVTCRATIEGLRREKNAL
jgi:hypothetical protein